MIFEKSESIWLNLRLITLFSDYHGIFTKIVSPSVIFHEFFLKKTNNSLHD